MEENTKRTPTRAQVEVLMSDWLGNLREEGTFIHKNTKGSIERKVSKGSAFSDYFLGNTAGMREDDLLRQGREIAQTVVNGMTAENIKVQLGTDSYTDGSTINVSSDYFDDRSLSVGEKIDILVGYSTHEAAHVNYSDFERLQKMNETLKGSPVERDVKSTIANILEDERIEYKLGEDMPGLSDYLGCCKKHSFGSFEKDKKNDRIEATEPIPRFLNTLIGAVRYPTMLKEEQIIENYDELNAVRKILSPFPESTEAVFSATEKIYDVMKEIIKKDLEEKQKRQQEEQQQQQSQQGQGGGQSSGSGQGQQDQRQNQDQSGNGQSDQNGQQQNQQQADGQGSQSPSAGQGNGQISKKDIQQALEQALQSGDCQKLISAMKKNAEAPKSNGQNDSSLIQGYSSENTKMYVNGDAEKEGGNEGGSGRITYMRKVGGNAEVYNTALRKVKKYVPAMTKALRCRTTEKDYELQGEASGKLNTNKLVSLRCGNENIFTKRGNVTCDSACICILIDESGSMNAKRKDAARETAVLVNEAVKHIPNLELFTYGYTDNEMNIYCERNNANKYALGSTRSHGGTPTGQAMAIAAQRVRKMTQNKCLMLVITDGCPDSTSETKRQDDLLRKRNFIPVGVWIAGEVRNASDMMKDSVTLTSLPELAPQIGKIVRKKLLKTLQKHDSM